MKEQQERQESEIPEQFRNFDRDEQSLLLFLQFCAVNRGLVAGEKMNKLDFDITERFETMGLLKFRRIKTWEPEFMKPMSRKSHLVMLTPLGFDVATFYHKARQQRWLDEYGFEPDEERAVDELKGVNIKRVQKIINDLNAKPNQNLTVKTLSEADIAWLTHHCYDVYCGPKDFTVRVVK